jgi:transposase
MEQRSLFGLSEHLEKLSAHGDPLEVLAATVEFEYFRGWLVEGLGYGDGSKGGRPPFDPVSMFKALILQAQHNLSDARMEFMIRDRLSWMRFLDFDLGGPTPDENTIRHFRNRLTETGTLTRVMKAFDWQLRKKGYIPMSGQIVDASLVPAPKQRNTDGEREAIKAGKSAKEIWPDEPNKAAQKDTSARWTLKVGGKQRYRRDGTPLPMIAVPVFGYKSHISIDPPRLHPRERGDLRLGGGRAHAPASGDDGQHILGGLGGQRRSLPKEREMAGVEDADQPRPPPQTGRQADAGGDRPGERAEILHPRPDRTCLRPSEEPLRALYPHDRPGARRGETDARQSGLQLRSPDLP